MKLNKDLYYRLIALWIVCEAFAGGVLHAANIPFSGMIVSGLAVTCIILIGYYYPSTSAILKATLLVAIFKLLLSPHSPPTAYIAVFFQGYLGQLFFQNKKGFVLKAIVLGILALAESAVQRILVLWIIYGTGFWQAFDQFVQKLTGSAQRYSLWLAGSYVLLHIVAGWYIGWSASRLARKALTWKEVYPQYLIDLKTNVKEVNTPRKKRIRLIFLFTWLLLAFLYVLAYLQPSEAILPAGTVTRILLRSLLILLTWYLLLSPILMRLLKGHLLKQKKKWQQPIAHLTRLLPQIKTIFRKSWKLSATVAGYKRFRLFIKILFVNIFTITEPGESSKLLILPVK